MPEGGTEHLRIYCICGQKMKVSESMYGLPGKCIACRQKMRIPRLDEIPSGTFEIHLKDHPEFLRKPKAPRTRDKKRSRPPREEPPLFEKAEAENLPAAQEEPPADEAPREKPTEGAALPLDILSPLRDLCSIQYKLERQLETLDDALPDNEADRAEIQGHLERVRGVRAGLDEKNRQMLMESAIELAGTQDKSAQECLAARVGERSFDEFQENIERLRKRRDRLERRQKNLQGWIATTDPHLAGGFIDLPIDSAAEDGFSISIPSEPEDPEPLLGIHTAALRAALQARAHAELKLAELDRLQENDPGAVRGYQEARADCHAEKQIAATGIAFARERLEQLKKDYTSDMETARAQLDLARTRMQTGEIDPAQFSALERQLLSARNDAAKAKSVVDRALSANTEQDVPHPRGTFLERLAASREDAATQTDSWVAWVAACAMGLSIFLPSVGGLSLFGAFLEFGDMESPVRWTLFGPIVFALLAALTAALPERTLRGQIMALIWFAATVMGAFAIHQAQFGIDPMSARFRTGAPWPIRPGILLLLLSNLGILAACALALPPGRARRIGLSATLAAALLATGALFTDAAGYFRPEPTLSVSIGGPAPSRPGLPTERQTTISVLNRGHRTMTLLSHASDARAAYLYLLEQRIGPNSWSEVPGHALPRQSASSARPGPRTIAPGETAQVTAALPPGDYRALLISKARGQEWPLPFSIQEDLPPAAPEPGPAPPASDPLPEVELRGIISPADGKPKFSFTLYFPGGTQTEGLYTIGETLHGPWDIAEYNPSLNTVTLNNQKNLLILRRGDRIALAP